VADTAQDTAQEEVGYSEGQIAVHWREEEYVEPPEESKEHANANDTAWGSCPRRSGTALARCHPPTRTVDG
jgi:hypothetical protein